MKLQFVCGVRVAKWHFSLPTFSNLAFFSRFTKLAFLGEIVIDDILLGARSKSKTCLKRSGTGTLWSTTIISFASNVVTWKLAKLWCTRDCSRYYFSNRVINRWNQPDQRIVDASSINAFKGCLDKI